MFYIMTKVMGQSTTRWSKVIHKPSKIEYNLSVSAILKLWSIINPAKATKFLIQAKKLGSTALQDVRQSVSAMRSNPLEGSSFEEAIASLSEELHHLTGISPTFIMLLPHPLPTEVATAVYRITQESPTNIYKYSQVTQVKIRLEATPNKL